MANIAEFNIDGASYTYDTESRDPLTKKNMKKVIACEMVYDIDSKIPTEPAYKRIPIPVCDQVSTEPLTALK